MISLDTCGSPNLIREEFVVTTWTPLLQTVKSSFLRMAANKLLEVGAFIRLHLQIGHLHAKVEVLVVPGLATNTLLETAFISLYIENISSKTEAVSSVNLGPAAFAEVAQKSLAEAVKRSWHRVSVVAPCAVARSMKLSQTSETIVRVMTSAEKLI